MDASWMLVGIAAAAAVGAAAGLAWRRACKARRRQPAVLRVAQLWRGRLVREVTYPRPRDVTVGEGQAADFVLPGLPGCRPLVLAVRGEGHALALSPGMTGSLRLNGSDVPVGRFVVHGAGEAATQVPLGDGDTGLVEVGEVAFFVQRVRPGTVVGRQRLLAADRGLVAATAVGAFVLVGLVVTSQLLWDPTAEAGQRAADRRYLSVELRVAPEDAEPAKLDVTDESAPGRRAAGEKGRFGDPNAPVERISKVPRREGLLVDRIDPSRIALVDVLRRETIRTGALTDIVSDTALAFDNRMAVAMDGTGSELDIGFGAGGMGFKGTGPGGGGDTYGRIHGGGRIDGPGGPGHGVRAGLGPKATARVVEVVGTGGSTTEFCDRNGIQRVVRMRAAMIRACYEQSLQVDEGLAGKVSVRWTIGGDGRVDGVSVLESTIGSAAVERCVLAAIRGMRFDPPTEGVCVVAWPFVFRADR